MGAIKWTGKGLKIIGELLSQDAVEQWLKEKGQEFIEEKSKSLACGWFMRNTRARHAAYADIASVVNRSPTFAKSPSDRLEKLPSTLARIAEIIKTTGPREISVEFSLNWLVVVPRYIVKTVFSEETIETLEKSNELRRFEGLPSIYLRDVCGKTEAALFEFAGHEPVACGN